MTRILVDTIVVVNMVLLVNIPLVKVFELLQHLVTR